MTCEELGKEYEQQAEAIERLIDKTRKRVKDSHGETQVQLRRDLKMLYSIAQECRETARYLKRYNAKGVKADEDGLYRQRPVGLHYAMPYTLKCFSLRGGIADGVAN